MRIKERGGQITIAIGILVIVLFLRLFQLTVLQTDKWTAAASNNGTKEIYTFAPRGEILDRYGRLLAGNRPFFTIQFQAGQEYTDEELNQQALKLIELLEQMGDAYIDQFPIIFDGQGGFRYTFDDEIQAWLTAQNMPADFTAEQAFEELRLRNNVDDSLDDFDAQRYLINQCGITPPISVKKMKYMKEMERDQFLDRFQMKSNLSAEEAFFALREKFKVDSNLSNEQARKIVMIRNILAAQKYYSYLPITVAQGVSKDTVILLEERRQEFPCVSISKEAERYYPNGKIASHILGYIGKIPDRDWDSYAKKGYRANDMIGQEGIERQFESELKGVNGLEKVMVDSQGNRVEDLEKTLPQKGKDIYLTIDLELQKTAEASLEQTLTKMQRGGTFESQWGNYSFKTYPNAKSGAVVALDVKTGEILALASYPSFDPNEFIHGISQEKWNELQGQNLQDQMAPRPLLNIACNTSVQPGSIFKPITAIAGLESGLDPNKTIYDKGFVRLGNRDFRCADYNLSNGRVTHRNENMYKAISVSCNYYFYCLVSNRNWTNNSSMGMDSSMSVDKVLETAGNFGLGKKTGIELPESITALPSKETKRKSYEGMLRRWLTGTSKQYFTPEVCADADLLKRNIETIVNWTGENPSRADVIERLEALGVQPDKRRELGNICKDQYYMQARWTRADAFNISIGQGDNAYTPVQVANYVATLGNGGILNPVTLVRGVEGDLGGSVETAEAEAPAQSPFQAKNLEIILNAMEEVAAGAEGGARRCFQNFPVPVAVKTGTAEKSGKVPVQDEVEYTKKHLAAVNSRLTWEQVEEETNRLLNEESGQWTSRNRAVRQAVVNLNRDLYHVSSDKTLERLDQFKSDYAEFAWFICLAPREDPKIAVAVLLIQGGLGANGAPVAREIAAQYLGLSDVDDMQAYEIDTKMTN